MNIARHIEDGGRDWPARPALCFEGGTLGYGALDAWASRVADVLLDLGLSRGDRVGILLPNSPFFAAAYLGIQKIGAIAVSVNTWFKAAEAAFVLGDSGCVAAITTAELRPRIEVERLPALRFVLVAGGTPGSERVSFEAMLAAASPLRAAVEMRPEEPSSMLYTSGTMGQPKGATLSHGNILFNMEAKRKYLGLGPRDRLLLFLPLYHCFAQNAVLNSGLYSGATIVIQRTQDPERILDTIRKDGITVLFGVPTTYILLLERAQPEQLRSIRLYFSAAAPLPREVEARWRQRFGLSIHQGYGLTETAPFACYNHATRPKPGSIGTPLEGVQMKIADPETGSELPPGLDGEILIKGPNVMLGYWGRPQETAAVLRDGWFHTGDLGHRDEEGYYFFTDRLKDMVNIGGLKVYPAEVEGVLRGHPAVAEAGVVGVPDQMLGEQLEALVVRRAGQQVEAGALAAHCRGRLANYKVPGTFRFVDGLPKGATGKLLRRELRLMSREMNGPTGGEKDGN